MRLEPLVFGTFCGIASSVLYTCANVCLRQVIATDPVWVSCIKAVPAVAVAGLLVLWRVQRGMACRVSGRALTALVVCGVFTQLGGNVGFQWSLGVIGLAISVPLTQGAMIISGALLGRFWLGEGVAYRSAVAMLVLISAIALLSMGTKAANTSLGQSLPGSGPLLALGVGVACLAGVAYSALGAVIRRVVTGTSPLSMTVMIVAATGVVFLGAISAARIGWQGMLNTPAIELQYMFAAGVFNALAFVSLAKALQLIPMAQVNAVMSCQTAMAALAGVAIFGEPLSVVLVLGVVLTMVGLMLLERPPTSSDLARHKLAATVDGPAIEAVDDQLPSMQAVDEGAA